MPLSINFNFKTSQSANLRVWELSALENSQLSKFPEILVEKGPSSSRKHGGTVGSLSREVMAAIFELQSPEHRVQLSPRPSRAPFASLLLSVHMSAAVPV